MSRTRREAETHRLIAGETALDFANTLNGHTRPAGHEYLHDFTDLALWCQHAGIFSAAETRGLMGQASRQPAQAAELYRRTLALREVIFRIFHSIAEGSEPNRADVSLLSSCWREGQHHAEIRRTADRFSIRLGQGAELDSIPWILSAAAVETLVSEKTNQIKACSGAGCDWLFVDGSRNHLRRWCSMDECGNRAKMRRRQRRKRNLGEPLATRVSTATSRQQSTRRQTERGRASH